MSGSDLAVLIGAVVLLFAVGWFFFAPRKATHTTSEGDNQSIEIIVKGGYSPDTIQATVGVPLHITFDRQERCLETLQLWVVRCPVPRLVSVGHCNT